MPPEAKCLNPTFAAWLEEMRDEVDPESNMRNVYNRAIKSMRAHDRYLEHPKDSAEVRYVGPRLRDRLIQRHNELQGVTPAPSQDSTKPSTSRAKAGKPRPKTTKSQAVPDANSSDGSVDAPRQTRIGDAPSLDAPSSIPATKASKKTSRGRGAVTSKTLSGSESEPGLMEGATPVKAPRIKPLPRPRNVAATPRSSKRTKSVPERPRLSDFIPAPAATSDIEPDDDRPDRASNTPSSSSEFLVFPAGTYTIQLILDEREVKSTKNRDYILKGLQKRGVDAEKRALEIGDVCWVARSKDPIDESRAECVLDYILERKRMDDLKSSILDGRFNEQKFRLKHTGISHVYYLVEDYDTERIARQWKDQINTAVSSTQVIDRFLLKETTSIEDTLDYLSGLHKTILMLHKDRALYIIPPQLIKRHRFLALKKQLRASDPERVYHTTYQSYQILNRKNGFYTLQDNMARILQCIRGLSEEKIAALIEFYPTPRSLYEAFKEAEEKQSSWQDPTTSQTGGKGKGKRAAKSGAPNPEVMLAELGGQGRRKIGPALSKHIYEVFMSHAYEG